MKDHCKQDSKYEFSTLLIVIKIRIATLFRNLATSRVLALKPLFQFIVFTRRTLFQFIVCSVWVFYKMLQLIVCSTRRKLFQFHWVFCFACTSSKTKSLSARYTLFFVLFT